MTVKPFLGESELLDKIARRDEHAFGIVYELYHRKIYTFSLQLLKSTELAEEVMQESFLKIWLLGEALMEVRNIESYLLTISRNKCLDILRQMEREAKADRNSNRIWTEEHNETMEAILLQDTMSLLQSGVDLLPPQQKLVYQLCHQQGLKYEEAAQKLNLSPLTIKKHMQHALRFLRTYIAKNSDLAIALIILKLI